MKTAFDNLAPLPRSADRRPRLSAISYVRLGHQWARRVVEGKIPANMKIRQACERQLQDLRRSIGDWQYRFDATKAGRVCRFIETLRHTKGKWMGQPIRLEPWQCFSLVVPFGWVWKSTGARRFRIVFEEVPRKNAKSTKVAGVGLYCLVADGEGGAEVYSGATTEKQAWEVFRPARLMALNTPGFKKKFKVSIGAKNLAVLATGSRFEPVIGKPGDGASPSCGIVDEYHEHDGPVLYDTFLTGMGSREQAIQWVVTTAGSNTSSPCKGLYDYASKVVGGTVENEILFVLIFELDPEDEWDDFENWKKVNPNYGISIFEDSLIDRHREAIQLASKQNVLRCKHLDQWCSADSAWLNILDWRKCKDEDLTLDLFAGKQCYCGLDLSSKTDIASLNILFRLVTDFYLFGLYYLPEDTIELPENDHYRKWRAMGLLIETPGAIIDYDYIMDDLRDLKTRFEMRAVGYDPFQATKMATDLLKEGFPMIEIPQQVRHFSEPMKEFEALVLGRRRKEDEERAKKEGKKLKPIGKLHHDGNPVLEWMISNIVCHYDRKDNIFPTKEKPQNKIDGGVSSIMALSRCLFDEGPKVSVYERRGVIVMGGSR